MTADVLETAQQQGEFWEQAQNGFVAQLGSDATVLSSEVKEISGKQVLHFVVSAGCRTTNASFLANNIG
jgi:hypothetical protein